MHVFETIRSVVLFELGGDPLAFLGIELARARLMGRLRWAGTNPGPAGPRLSLSPGEAMTSQLPSHPAVLVDHEQPSNQRRRRGAERR
jgi:hypothetical protein